ncbi:hypothetical protein [Heliophilum fasciatum]|uniref:Uncharacterized protein n=1 Tax=Heliophilum fasciatum TaxID=35700 RepID=A0A4R2RDZ0_9FIRM|nr:hypothetical protein [Heliophilum fasciatum]MCW2279164.1 hypothetical protein [Heliophilum fasciatum]TCP61023.1 hypothetical protein EDD73_13118 [Heliophilum fasciatum]
MWSSKNKTAVHDTGFEFGQAGWFAFHAVAIPTMMYVGKMMSKSKNQSR